MPSGSGLTCIGETFLQEEQKYVKSCMMVLALHETLTDVVVEYSGRHLGMQKYAPFRCFLCATRFGPGVGGRKFKIIEPAQASNIDNKLANMLLNPRSIGKQRLVTYKTCSMQEALLACLVHLACHQGGLYTTGQEADCSVRAQCWGFEIRLSDLGIDSL